MPAKTKKAPSERRIELAQELTNWASQGTESVTERALLAETAAMLRADHQRIESLRKILEAK